MVGHGLAHIISYPLCELRDILHILLVHQDIMRKLIITVKHLDKSFVNGNTHSLQLLGGNLHRARSGIIIVNRMAKIAIRHPHGTHSANELQSLVRSDQRLFCSQNVTHTISV